MNLDTASKFELNKRLAELYLPCEYIVNDEALKVELANYQDVMVGYMHDQILMPYAEFNPCTNWNDIMPIAFELGVSYIKHKESTSIMAISDVHFNIDGVLKCDEYVSCTSPQIALVKCCIKVLEARNG